MEMMTTDLDRISGADLDATQDRSRPLVLVVDDDKDYVALVKLILRQAQFNVISAYDARTALEKCIAFHPDVILLDISMPEIDGWQTYQHLREVTHVPIIAVTAVSSREDAVRGLTLGMDEYLTKPFYNPELVARIKTVLRRNARKETSKTRFFPDIGLKINVETRQVTIHGQFIHLQRREFEVLIALAEQAPNCATYEYIAESVWGEDSASNRARIKNIVALLRQKMEVNPKNPMLILNHSGVGYKLVIVPPR